jgi:hypothetical protein
MTIPSNRVHDTFRERSAGKVNIPVNSKPAFDQFHISRERLGTHEEYDETAPNDYGGTGKYVETPNDIRRNVVGAMGDILAKSSFKNPEHSENTGSGPCCVPYLPGPYSNSKNPMYKGRKGE